MGRDLLWFRHEVGSSRGRKFTKLRLKAGWEAIGIYWAIAEEIYRSSNCYPFASDEDKQVLAACLNIDLSLLEKVITACEASENLLKIVDGHLTSDRIAEEFETRLEISEKRAKSGAKGGKANAKQMLSKVVAKTDATDKTRQDRQSKREAANSPHPKKQEKILKGDPPTEQNDKIPIQLQELFRSQNKTEQIKNVWLTDAECERISKKWGLHNFDLACQQMSAWSVNPDINAKTKLAGWESYRLKRDHAGTMENILKRLESEGKLNHG